MKKGAALILLMLAAFAGRGKEYVFFLHNKFLEIAKPGEKHPEYGSCEYREIINSFEQKGFTVISELRPLNTDGDAYAKKVVRQIDSLINTRKVNPSSITVVGTSKGGYIAELVSGYLKNKQVNFVFIGCCDDEVKNNPSVSYYGNILSIYEQSDAWHSCQKMKDLSGPNVTRFKEKALNTGLKHGYLYKALDHWIEPAAEWAHGHYEQAGKNVLSNKIDSLLNTGTMPFNGVVLISRRGVTTYAKCKGYADMDTKKTFKFTDRFIIGSISKQVTAVLVLQEYERGHIKLDVPIRHYLPQLKQKWADSVTVHHLLSHTHGINEDDPSKPLQFTPGTRYDYSQYGFQLLAMIVERVAHKSFEALADSLFRKCGMYDTYYPPEGDTSFVKGYIMEGGKTRLRAENEALARRLLPAGGFVSTAPDLAVWNERLFNGKLLKDKTFRMMTSKQKNAVRDHPIFGPTAYGYGITVEDKGNVLQLGQTGGLPGFASMNFYLPATKQSIIVLANLWDIDNIKKTFQYHMAVLNAVKAYEK